MAVRIAVVIPTYNRAHIVGTAIESVLAQTRPADQIIVVDDGGKDDTMSFLATYGDRIIPFRKENGGLASARNAGIAQVDCDWIAFLDDDDVWPAERLAVLERDVADAPRDVVAHLGNLAYTGPGYNLDLFGMKGMTFPAGRAVRVEDAMPLVISGMSVQSAAVRKDAYLRAGRFDETLKMYEDTIFFWHMALEGPFLVTGDILSEVRRLENDPEAMTTLHLKSPIPGDTVYVEKMQRLLERPMTDAQRQVVRQKLSGSMFHLALLLTEQDRAAARRMFLRAARAHPSPAKGWIKSLIGLSPARGLLRPSREATMLRQ